MVSRDPPGEYAASTCLQTMVVGSTLPIVPDTTKLCEGELWAGRGAGWSRWGGSGERLASVVQDARNSVLKGHNPDGEWIGFPVQSYPSKILWFGPQMSRKRQKVISDFSPSVRSETSARVVQHLVAFGCITIISRRKLALNVTVLSFRVGSLVQSMFSRSSGFTHFHRTHLRALKRDNQLKRGRAIGRLL